MSLVEKKQSGLIPGAVLLGISIFLVVGVNTVFHACVHEDGTDAVCHWAQQGVFACGIVSCFTALLLVLVRDRRVQMALSAVMICEGVVIALVPDVFIRLCMIPSMRCHTVMRPWVLVIGLVMVLISVVNLVLRRK